MTGTELSTGSNDAAGDNGEKAAQATVRDGKAAITSTQRRVPAAFRSTIREFLAILSKIDFVNAITLFGTAFLFSALPLFIILDSFAGARVDQDLAHHMGLNAQAARIVGTLFVAG